MVYAMFIVFLLFLYIHTVHCQTTISPKFIYNCSFSNNAYSTNAAVTNQFQFNNNTSILLTASYAFLSSPLSISSFDFGLIYQFATSNYLVPFPIIFNCPQVFNSCQLTTMAGTTIASRDSEPILVQLTSFNYTTRASVLLNQAGLYLKQGQYQLSNCSSSDGTQITDPQTIFNIQIQYEKPVGTSCNPISDTCGSSSLTTCSSSSSTCTCLSTSPLVSYSSSFYCADTLNATNCGIFPTRCVTWCNSTTNYLCICPSGTLKIQRNNSYVCELPVDSLNCSTNDNIVRCPLGQYCNNGQCIDDITTIITTATTTTKTIDSNDSTDLSLRIALGVIAGLLGTSVLVLLGTLCWLRQRQKRRRLAAEKSLSPSSSTSSLYISPIQQQQQQQQQQRRFSSTPSIYQLPYAESDIENQTKLFSPTYRTDSFRQAVLSGNRRSNQTIEHVSTKRDSFVGRSVNSRDDFFSSAYGTLEFNVPSSQINNQNQLFDLDNRNNNIYQVIVPSSSPTILTHAV